MNEVFEQALKRLNKKFQGYGLSADSLKYLPENLEARYMFIHDDHITITIPYDDERIARLLDDLDRLGWTVIRDYIQPDNGERYIHLDHPEVENRQIISGWGSLIVGADPTQVGSACIRRQVGTKEVPVYEIVCKEA